MHIELNQWCLPLWPAAFVDNGKLILMNDDLYIAIDLGAGSGRVFLAGVGPDELLLEETRRFHYPPQCSDGHLRWGFGKIWDEIKAGLRAAGARARELKRPVRSIGVDSWAVDYGLVDGGGELLENPVCYRDARARHDGTGLYPEISVAILDQKVAAIEAAKARAVVAADASCLMQIGGRLSRQKSAAKALRLAEVLASQE